MRLKGFILVKISPHACCGHWTNVIRDRLAILWWSEHRITMLWCRHWWRLYSQDAVHCNPEHRRPEDNYRSGAELAQYGNIEPEKAYPDSFASWMCARKPQKEGSDELTSYISEPNLVERHSALGWWLDSAQRSCLPLLSKWRLIFCRSPRYRLKQYEYSQPRNGHCLNIARDWRYKPLKR